MNTTNKEVVMNVSNQHIFYETTPERVWNVLLNPAYWRDAVPNCRRLEGVVYQHQCTLVIQRPLGHYPVQDYAVDVTFHELRPHERFGFDWVVTDPVSSRNWVRGKGEVAISPDAANTTVQYHLTANAAGTFADVGPLLLETLTRSTLRQTLDALAAVVSTPHTAAIDRTHHAFQQKLSRVMVGLFALVPVVAWLYRRRD